jgi:hypothetical protein
LLEIKRQEIGSQKQKLSEGLDKLYATNEVIKNKKNKKTF